MSNDRHARHAYGAGAAPFSRPSLAPGQDLNVEANPAHHYFPYNQEDDDDDDDLADSLIDRAWNHASQISASLLPHLREPSAIDASGSDADGEDGESSSEGDNPIVWASDSEDDDAGESQDHDQDEHTPDPESPRYAHANERSANSNLAGERDGRIIEDSGVDSPHSSTTVSDSEHDHATPSPSPSPIALPHDDAVPHARSGSDLGTISDSEAESESSLASASQRSLSEQSNDPQLRRGARRCLRRDSPSESDSEEQLRINNRSSPRRSSLTPVYHPNRRLPRQSPAHASGRLPSNPLAADNSDISDDEPLVLQPSRRHLGIERTRRPRLSNPARIVLGVSDDEALPLDDEGLRLSPWPPQQDVVLPDSPHHGWSDDYSDLDSDYGDHAVHHAHEEEEPAEEDHSDEDSSDLFVSEEEGMPQSEGSQSVEGQEVVQIESDDEDEVNQAHQGPQRDQAAARLRLDQQRRRDNFFRQQALDDDLDQGNINNNNNNNNNNNIGPVLEFVNDQAFAHYLSDSDNPQPLGARSNSDAGEDIMDLEDELVEVVIDNFGQRPQQRQANQPQNNQAHSNQGGAIDVIDLTEEPDSPVLHQHVPRHQGDANQARLLSAFGHHEEHQPVRNARRMNAQHGGPPSLARSDGSILGNPGRVTLIDLTNDDEPDELDNIDDDEDGLFVRQHYHIPANRRLPQPVPAPQRRNNRRSAEFFDLARDFIPEMPGNLRRFIGRLGHMMGPYDGLAHNLLDPHGPQFNMDANVNPNPLADNPPNFNYQANGWAVAGERPKPQFEEPPAARPGFTRNTGPDPETGEEQVFVCAGCDEELKYYDDEVDDRPAKRAKNTKSKSRKIHEEHHFWAVKACGHVYCKHCYDNRLKAKYSAGQDQNTGFRHEAPPPAVADASGQQKPKTKQNKIFCAVEECDSEVRTTNCWVGIFM